MLDTHSPVTPLPEQPAANDPIPVGDPTHYLTKSLLLIILVLIGVVGYLIYSLRYSTSLSLSPTPSPSSTPYPLAGFTPMPDASNQLAYLKDPNREVMGDEQLVLINPSTKQETPLDIKQANYVYKYYGSDLLFYFVQNDRGEYHVLNLKTGHDRVYDLLDHTDNTVGVNIGINNISEISPDGKYLVFYGSYFTPCPFPSPLPSGFEGGYGPCGPAESLDNPTGYFLYDFESSKATFLQSELPRVSRWDTINKKLYFVDGSSTKVLDLVNKSYTFLDSTSHFGYYTYPLLRHDKLVKLEGSTGDSGSAPFTKLSLLTTSDQSTLTIDQSPSWTDIQPFITANQSESDVFYQRSTNVKGLHRNSIYRYNLLGAKLSQVTKKDNSLSYSFYLAWLGDHEFVTFVDLVNETNFSQTKRNLVKIDLNTQTETMLTDHDQVTFFNTQ